MARAADLTAVVAAHYGRAGSFLGGMGRGPAARGQSADGIDRIDLAPFPAP
jgi:hypothetical protein